MARPSLLSGIVHRRQDVQEDVSTRLEGRLVLDGKIFDTDRCRLSTISTKGEQIDSWYPGKTHDFGGNVQALFELDGSSIWTSDIELGHTVDNTAARAHVPPTARTRAADPGRCRLRRRRPRCPYPVQAARRRRRTPPRKPHLQHPAALSAQPGRTRLRPAHRTLDHAPADHPQPQPDRRSRPGRPRPGPFRTPPDHLNVSDKTSLAYGLPCTRNTRRREEVIRSRRNHQGSAILWCYDDILPAASADSLCAR